MCDVSLQGFSCLQNQWHPPTAKKSSAAVQIATEKQWCVFETKQNNCGHAEDCRAVRGLGVSSQFFFINICFFLYLYSRVHINVKKKSAGS